MTPEQWATEALVQWRPEGRDLNGCIANAIREAVGEKDAEIARLEARLAEAERLLRIWAGEASDKGETAWEDTAAFLAGAAKESK